VGVRLGLTALLLVVFVGIAASAAQVWHHYHNRDESDAMTLDDLRAAYHGLNRPAPLLTALERGHPATLKPEQREVLLKWLRSGRIAEDYESIDLGPASPGEIISASCVSCHSPRGTDAAARATPLDTIEHIRTLASSKQVNRNPDNVIIASMHAHALALTTLSIALLALLCATRLPRGVVSLLAALHGLGLLADIGSWWLARQSEPFVYVIAGAGWVYNGTLVLIALLVIADLWLPRKQSSRP
jgi:hypothetical protein